MARQTINIGSAANDGNGDTLRVGATKINENFAEIYTQLGGGDDGIALTDAVRLVDSGLEYVGVTYNTVLTSTEGTEKLVFVLPDSGGTIIVDSADQKLYRKHLYNTKIDGDLRLHGVSGTGYYLINYEGTVPTDEDRNVNFPALTDSDTIVFEAHTQTLTNKTLTEPTLSLPLISDAIRDANTANILKFSASSSAVNEITLANAASGNGPEINASGDDTNVNLNVNPKGTGVVRLGKVAYSSKQITSGESTDSDTFIVMNPTSPTSFAINDGTINGELKILLNRGTAAATLTSSNFAFGSTLEMNPNALVQMIWESVETNWHLLGTDSSGPSITIA